MSSNDNPMPDLASVLRILASLPPQSQNPQSQPQPPPPEPNNHAPRFLQPPSQQQAWLQTPLPHDPHRSSTPANRPKVIDPSTIIEWNSGLRCVMKTVANHENLLSDIRRMIKTQNEHEEQWWSGRQALIERQKAREEGQKKLDDVLKLVGGSVAPGTCNNSPEELAKELETFDMKVHKAQTQMVREMTAKLRSLGVPFFGTKSELVRISRKDGAGGGGLGEQKDGKGMIDEVELVKLQRKMLAILEDLCSE